LYAKVFAEYVHRLLEEGFNIKIFIEGTRSRTGKLMMPRLGFLSILLNAHKNGACEDLVFAPIYIGYDRILEETAYIREVEGGKKEPENLKQVLRARKFLKNRYGKIYIKFHEPISLNQLLTDQYTAALEDMNVKEQNALCRDLGWRIINAINSVTVVTAYGLVSSAVLNCPLRLFSLEDLLLDIDTYLNILNAQNADMTDTLRHDHVGAVNSVLDNYVQRKLLEKVSNSDQDDTKEDQYQLNVNKRPLLEYYKNNCVSYFIPAAFTALAILGKDAFQFASSDLHDTYTFLRSFFKYEFAYNLDLKPEYFVRKSIKTFINDAILVPHQTMPDTYNMTSAGLRKLKSIAKFLKTYFESYWIVLSTFKKYAANDLGGKDRLKKIQAKGSRMYKRKEIDLPESLSKINYDNAINYFTTHDIKGSEDAERIAYYEDIIQKYLKLLSS
jgi:glycerol-3-phosphate O-acyltransferase